MVGPFLFAFEIAYIAILGHGVEVGEMLCTNTFAFTTSSQ